MLLDWLERARKKPKAVRNQYAFVGAVTLTSLIALIWTLSLPAHFAGVDVATQETAETRGAFAQFFDDAKQNFAAVMQAGRGGPATSSPATATPEATSTRAASLELTPENIAEINAEQEPFQFRESRPILIGTSSATTSQAADPENTTESSNQLNQATSTTQEP